MHNETWRQIAGFDCYEVSDRGRVRSWRGRAKAGKLAEPRLRNPSRDQDGYMRVGLESNACGESRKDGKRRQVMRYVHDIVLQAFSGPPPAGTQCRHKDGSKDNNHIDNLCWGTPLENSRDKQAHGTQCRGRDIYLAKLDETRVRAIRSATGLLREIAAKFNVSIATVGKIRNRQTWAWVSDE